MRLYSIFVATLCGVTFLAAPYISSAATMHVIIAANTNDLTIGTGAGASEKSIEEYFQHIALRLGMTPEAPIVVDKTDFQTNNGGCARIQDALAQPTIKPDDVVIFYYAAHGFKSPKKFPYFNCTGDVNPKPPYFGLRDVATILTAKGPHLIVAIADTCNKQAQEPPSFGAAPTSAGPINDLIALRRLFVDSNGVVLLAAASRGQFAYYLDTGGFFTNQLLDAFAAEIALQESAQWKDLTKRATQVIPITYKGKTLERQAPIFDLSGLTEAAPTVAAGFRVIGPT